MKDIVGRCGSEDGDAEGLQRKASQSDSTACDGTAVAVRLKVSARNENLVLEFPPTQYKLLLSIQEALIRTGARIQYTDVALKVLVKNMTKGAEGQQRKVSDDYYLAEELSAEDVPVKDKLESAY